MLAGVLLVVGVPIAVRAVPPADSDIDASRLLALVRAGEDRPYGGYVETRGALQLPVTDRFTDLGALVGERTRLRVWWRDHTEWRVDKLSVQGETDLVHGAGVTTQWSYESSEARVSVDPAIRLPRTADLLPPELGRRLLSDVDAGEVSRLRTRSVAGIAAPGLRLEPAAVQSSIGHVDVWADPDSGVPLRVEVYADGAVNPSFTSEFREFEAGLPDCSTTTYEPSPDADLSFDDVLDIADAANQYAHLIPPEVVGGLSRSAAADGAVGVYGAGVTQMIAIPLRGREAAPLREQLQLTPGSRLVEGSTVVPAGALGVLLTGSDDDGGWLVAGTVTEATLVAAAEDLLTRSRFRGGHS